MGFILSCYEPLHAGICSMLSEGTAWVQGGSHLLCVLCAMIIHVKAPAPCMTPSKTSMCDNLQDLLVHTHRDPFSLQEISPAPKGRKVHYKKNIYLSETFYTPDLPQQLVFIQRSFQRLRMCTHRDFPVYRGEEVAVEVSSPEHLDQNSTSRG